MKKTKLLIVTLFWISTLTLSAQVEYKPKQPNRDKEQNITPPIAAKKIPKEPPRQDIIKINLLSPIFYTLMLSYQHNLNDDNSLQITAGYMNFDGFSSSNNNNINSIGNPHTEAFFITPEYRYLFKGDNMDGSYIAPFLKYTNMAYSADYSNNNYPFPSSNPSDRFTFKYQTLGVGICLGQQFIYKNKISLDIFAGPVYNMMLSKITPSNSPNYSKYSFNTVEIDYNIPNINIRGYGIRAGFTVGFLF